MRQSIITITDPYSRVKIQYLAVVVTTMKWIPLMHDQRHKCTRYLPIYWPYWHEKFWWNCNYFCYYTTFNIIRCSLQESFHNKSMFFQCMIFFYWCISCYLFEKVSIITYDIFKYQFLTIVLKNNVQQKKCPLVIFEYFGWSIFVSNFPIFNHYNGINSLSLTYSIIIIYFLDIWKYLLNFFYTDIFWYILQNNTHFSFTSLIKITYFLADKCFLW